MVVSVQRLKTLGLTVMSGSVILVAEASIAGQGNHLVCTNLFKLYSRPI